MKEEFTYPDPSGARPAPLFLRRVSWGAIFAGLVVTLVLQLLLTLLGVAIGASTIEPFNQGQSAKGYGIGAGIWLGLSSILSIFAGACVAGRLSGGPRKADGMLHGVATWATATLLGVFLVTTAVGNIIGGASRLLGQAMSSGLSAAASNSGTGGGGGANWDAIKQEVRNLVPQAGAVLPSTGRTDGTQSKDNLMAQAQQNPELMTVLTRMFSRGGAAADPQDREAAINLLTSQGNMSRDEAASAVDRWDQQYRQTKSQTEQKARQAGAAAVGGVATGAWWSFAILILSAIAAAFGGLIGTRGLSYIRPQASAAT